MVTQEGLEPPTLWFVVKYSNPAELLSHVVVCFILLSRKMVGPPGLEPGTDRLWAGCSNQLSYRPMTFDRKSPEGFRLRRDAKQVWSGKRDSNSRPPPWQGDALPTELFPHVWSGKRDSNSRPPPWQGDALPTELFPHVLVVCQCSAWLTRNIIHFPGRFVNTFFEKSKKSLKPNKKRHVRCLREHCHTL